MLSVPINATAAGANTLVAAVPGRRIRVLGFLLDASGGVTVTWQDITPANLSGPLTMVSQEPVTVAPIAPAVGGSELYWMITGMSQSLVLNLSAAVAVGGVLVYDYA
jgi:hypothetical protein